MTPQQGHLGSLIGHRPSEAPSAPSSRSPSPLTPVSDSDFRGRPPKLSYGSLKRDRADKEGVGTIMRTAKLSLYLGLVLTLTLGCGEDTEGPGSGGSVSCGDRAPGCFIMRSEGNGCVEYHDARLWPAVESVCADEGGTYVPDGCPLDDGRLGHCIIHTTSASSSITSTSVHFFYMTGDARADEIIRNLCASSSFPDSGVSSEQTWCPGSLP